MNEGRHGDLPLLDLHPETTIERTVMSTATTGAPNVPDARRVTARQVLFGNAELLTSLGPLVALILACAYFASQSDRFLAGPNFSLIAQQSMVVGILAIGQTLVILTAGIDLSTGAVMAFGS